MDANDSEAFTVDNSPQPYHTVESTATDYKKEKDYESNSEAVDSRLNSTAKRHIGQPLSELTDVPFFIQRILQRALSAHSLP